MRTLRPDWLFRVCAGTGTDLAIQTMAAGPYGLLLSNVNVGYGSRPWAQMGTTQSASSFMTVWNMNGQVKVGWLGEVERAADCYQNPAHADSSNKCFVHACRHSCGCVFSEPAGCAVAACRSKAPSSSRLKASDAPEATDMLRCDSAPAVPAAAARAPLPVRAPHELCGLQRQQCTILHPCVPLVH